MKPAGGARSGCRFEPLSGEDFRFDFIPQLGLNVENLPWLLRPSPRRWGCQFFLVSIHEERAY